MSDKLHIETEPEVTTARSRNMSRIRGKDTKPEMIVRKFLWSRGFRYRLNDRRLPGKPDLVLRKYRTCIFVNGCFWHGHNVIRQLNDLQLDNLTNSECCKIPHTRREFWVSKILRNQERDVEVQKKLAKMGWHSITVWECELRRPTRERTLESLSHTLNHIFLKDHSMLRYVLPQEEHQMAAEEMKGYEGLNNCDEE
ncbi:MAG: very short patch repair endonuclease [Prevotellaceae bacterium]|nr:very short patch repair endonuclease [Prevotellaceae bacterium]